MQKLPVLLHLQNLQLSNMPNARQKAKNLSSLQQLRLLDVFSSFIAVTDLQMSVTADDSYMILTHGLTTVKTVFEFILCSIILTIYQKNIYENIFFVS